MNPNPHSGNKPCREHLYEVTESELIEVLWSLSLSENLGDVSEAIEPLLKKFRLPTLALPALNEELERRGLVPSWAKDD